jgi:hypothetical protein
VPRAARLADVLAEHIARCAAENGISDVILRRERYFTLPSPSPLEEARHRLSLGRALREIDLLV